MIRTLYIHFEINVVFKQRQHMLVVESVTARCHRESLFYHCNNAVSNSVIYLVVD